MDFAGWLALVAYAIKMPSMLHRIVIFCALMGCFALAASQQHQADSLERLVKSVSSDTTKVWLLNDLVNSLRERDNQKALKYALEARDLAQLLGYKRGLAKAENHIGWIYYRTGQYSKSLAASTRSLKISQELTDDLSAATALVNIGAIYYEQKQYPLAIQNFSEAYRIGKNFSDPTLMARSCNNMAYSFLAQGSYDSSKIYSERALALGEEHKLPYMRAFAHRTLGDIALEQKRINDALAQYQLCYVFSSDAGNTFIQSSVLHRISKAYFLSGKTSLAIEKLKENIAIARQYHYQDELERAYKLLSEIYFKRNDMEQAYAYQSAYVAIHDSLYNQRNSEQLALMQIRFDTEIKQAKIDLLTKDSDLKEARIRSQQLFIYFYIGCLILSMILAAVFYMSNRRNRKAKTDLEEKTTAIGEQAEQLKNLNATKDKLFSIISHDLRSPVASLKALMEIVSTSGLSHEEFVDVSKALKRNLDSVYEDLNHLLVWAQTQLKGIHAVPEEVALKEMIDDKIKLFEEFSSLKQLTIENHVPEGVRVWADRNHVSLIIRNLLGNAIKFNRINGYIHIHSVSRNGEFEISVRDSGVGISAEDRKKLFNPETHFTRPGTNMEKGVGIGLLLAKEFIEKNDGRISVKSVQGEGATFSFTLRASKMEAVMS